MVLPMTRYQRARRYAFWRGFLFVLFLITGFAGCSSLSGHVTAESFMYPPAPGPQG
jgi:hypothetical protein